MFLEDMNLLLQILSFQIHLQWTVVSNKHNPLWGETHFSGRCLPHEIWQTIFQYTGR